MLGWAGTILKFDLSSGEILKEELESSFAKSFLGGRGFNSKFIFDSLDPSVRPFDPQNTICVSAGLLSGTMAPSSGRLVVSVSRSPLTGYFCDGNAGGFFASEMAQAGYDLIIIRGRANKPVYIYIEDENVEIRDAKNVWGRDLWEATHVIQEEVDDLRTQVLAIGPAGESLSAQAAVICNLGRAAGAGGMGAVFGSKNLKAIAVRGSKGKRVARSDEFNNIVLNILNRLKQHPIFETWSQYGTTMLPSVMALTGNLTVMNWQKNIIKDLENLDGPSFYPRYIVKKKACDACPIHCSRFYRIPDGPFADTMGEGPEYVALMSLGTNLGITRIDAVLYLNTLANKLGLDIAEAGNTIATAMHWWQKGLISGKDTGGIDLTWGNVDSVIELMRQMAYRKGFGAILAEGLVKAATVLARSKGISEEEFTRCIYGSKGMTLRAVMEWREAKGVALSFATANRGADHLRGMPCLEVYAEWYGAKSPELVREWFGVPLEIAKKWFSLNLFDRNKYGGKGYMVKFFEDCYAAGDALGLCRFITPWRLGLGPEEMAMLTTAATGINFSWKDMLIIGERIWTVEIAIQRIYGLGREGDYPPKRVFSEPCGEGAAKGKVLDLGRYEAMLDEYYEIRGYDKNGSPKLEKLKELGLDNVVETLKLKGGL